MHKRYTFSRQAILGRITYNPLLQTTLVTFFNSVSLESIRTLGHASNSHCVSLGLDKLVYNDCSTLLGVGRRRLSLALHHGV